MIKAIIFDMDGLMFDTESAYSEIQTKMSLKRGKVFNNEVKAPLMGQRAYEVMSLLNNFWGINEKVEDLLKEQDVELIKLYRESVPKLRGLDNFIRFLNENKIRKCIGTSSRTFLVDILLEKFDLAREFEFVVSGDMVENGKPSPDIYQKCLKTLGLEGGRCLVLEDSLNGIKAAVASGCKSCAIPSEHTRQQDFSLANIIAESLDDKIIKDFILS